MEAGHPVTPSDQVDQAWHLHLTYTQSYWNDLCRDLLGRPLHHGPTRGGRVEKSKYGKWYQRTLDDYTRFFGHPPPADIWPPAEIRFGEDLCFQRVNIARNTIVPNKRHPVSSRTALIGTGIIMMVAVLYTIYHVGDTLPTPVLWLCTGLLGVFLTIRITDAFYRRCHHCKRIGGLRSTRQVENRGVLLAPHLAYVCKHCGGIAWKRIGRQRKGDGFPPDGCHVGGVDGGCSGGGCGGCG